MKKTVGNLRQAGKADISFSREKEDKMWGSNKKSTPTKVKTPSKRESFEERFDLDTFNKGDGLDLASVLRSDDFEEYDPVDERRATIGIIDNGLPTVMKESETPKKILEKEDTRRKSFSFGAARALSDHNFQSASSTTTKKKKKARRKSGSLPAFLRRTSRSSRRSTSQPALITEPQKSKSVRVTKAEALALAEAEVVQAQVLAQVKLKKLAELEEKLDQQPDDEEHDENYQDTENSLHRASSLEVDHHNGLPNIAEHEEAPAYKLPTPPSTPIDATSLTSDELIALIEEKTASANYGDEQAEAEIERLCALLESKTDL